METYFYSIYNFFGNCLFGDPLKLVTVTRSLRAEHRGRRLDGASIILFRTNVRQNKKKKTVISDRRLQPYNVPIHNKRHCAFVVCGRDVYIYYNREVVLTICPLQGQLIAPKLRFFLLQCPNTGSIYITHV